ncbi:uncharacterized protein [Palaemon carinicauda]|uniref:uncharacterized protein n=1 Tax=Palaemon carinicauda TaxID=392227 RepID=UPI0035B69BD9
MTSCTVKICCCGCTLQQGCLIIGWLMLVGSVLQAISYAASAINYGYSEYWGPFSISVLGVSMGLLLIFGVHKREPNYLKSWIVIEVFLLTVDLILAIVIAVMTEIFFILIIVVAICLLDIYFIVVVWSYALKLVEERNAGIMQMNAYQQPHPLYL